jgi:hypothetical protein
VLKKKLFSDTCYNIMMQTLCRNSEPDIGTTAMGFLRWERDWAQFWMLHRQVGIYGQEWGRDHGWKISKRNSGYAFLTGFLLKQARMVS